MSSESVNKKSFVGSPPRTWPPVLLNVKVDDVVVDNVSRRGVELSFTARHAREQLKFAMKSVYLVTWCTMFSFSRTIELLYLKLSQILEGLLQYQLNM